MTPKEKAKIKAKELIEKFKWNNNEEFPLSFAKQCALICVDVVFNDLQCEIPDSYPNRERADFWHYVKNEIKKTISHSQ